MLQTAEHVRLPRAVSMELTRTELYDHLLRKVADTLSQIYLAHTAVLQRPHNPVRRQYLGDTWHTSQYPHPILPFTRAAFRWRLVSVGALGTKVRSRWNSDLVGVNQ